MEGQPAAYWLSGLYFPQGFMTGVLQTHARKYGLAIDTLSFAYQAPPSHCGWSQHALIPRCHVLMVSLGRQIFKTEHTEMGSPPTDGVVCYGLYTDGCSFNWQDTVLVDSPPSVMHSPMPPIHFLPAVQHVPSKADYVAPLYKTSVRAGTLSTTGHSTNFVVSIALPSQQAPHYWILKAAALLCQLND